MNLQNYEILQVSPDATDDEIKIGRASCRERV